MQAPQSDAGEQAPVTVQRALGSVSDQLDVLGGIIRQLSAELSSAAPELGAALTAASATSPGWSEPLRFSKPNSPPEPPDVLEPAAKAATTLPGMVSEDYQMHEGARAVVLEADEQGADERQAPMTRRVISYAEEAWTRMFIKSNDHDLLSMKQRRDRAEQFFNSLRILRQRSEVSMLKNQHKRKLQILEAVVVCAVFTNSVELWLTLDGHASYSAFVVNIICYAVFVIEILVKLFLQRLGFLADPWNYFDFALVITGALSFILEAKAFGAAIMLRSLRFLRVLRILRFVRVFEELWIIIASLIGSVRAGLWIFGMLFLVLYIGALVCVSTIRDGTEDLYPGASDDFEATIVDAFNPKIYFGTVPAAMYTLFNLIVFAEFSEFGRPVFLQQPHFWPFFLLIIFICTFGLLNMLVGVVVENTMKNYEHMQNEKKGATTAGRMQKMTELAKLLDKDNSGSITPEELEAGAVGAEVKELMKDMNFPIGFDIKELFTLLSGAEPHAVGRDLFRMNGIRMLSASDDGFEWNCLLLLTMKQVLQRVSRVEGWLSRR